MKKTTGRKDLLLFAVLISSIICTSLLFYTCKKDEFDKVVRIETGEVFDITDSTAMVTGVIQDVGNNGIAQHGHCWSTDENPEISLETRTELGPKVNTGIFYSKLTDLTAYTTYYIRSYAIADGGTTYGDQVSFVANRGTPEVVTTGISSITNSSAVVEGNVTSGGGATVSARGVCWSTSENPMLSNNHTTDGSGTGPFTSSITGLTMDTTYYVRSYATNDVGTAYGNQISFTAGQDITSPIVYTNYISSITGSSALSGGNITSDGGSAVTTRGVCWSSRANPTIEESTTSDGSGLGAFVSSITGLSPGTMYYVRAYATNSAGISYGSQLSFTSLHVQGLAILTTSEASSITNTSAKSGGNISIEGDSPVTSRGICWSTHINPTISDNVTSDGIGPGAFVSTLDGLSSGTTYYVRAYATNTAGTAYGNQIFFETSQESEVDLPIVTTSGISSITDSTAQCGGNVTSDGGDAVTIRGVCWNTSSNPTISDYTSSDGSGTGSFVSNLMGLSSGTTYYVKAFASNSYGTAYGSEISFTTSGTLDLPVVETVDIVSITAISAAATGFISSQGTSAVSERGFCYSTSPNPTIAGTTVLSGSGTGSFNAALTILIPGTTYYIRAYAINSSGVGYGDEKYFTTSDAYYEGFESGFPATWIADGWGVTSSITAYEGFNCLQAVQVGDSISFTKTITTSPNGNISFHFSNPGGISAYYLRASFYIDDIFQASFAEKSWTMHSFSFPTGTHTFTWKITASYGSTSGAFIDYIIVSP